MTAEVVSLKGGEIVNERRDAFLQAVAASFDHYAARCGHEPDAIVYVLCGLKQESQIGWDVQGESAGGPTSILAVAAAHCNAEAQNTRTVFNGGAA